MIKTDYVTFIYCICILVITYYFSGLIDEVHAENRILQERIWELEGSITEFEVTATMYTPTRSQTDDTPHITADGTRLDVHNAGKYRFVAVSRDLLSRWGGPFEYGDYIVIEGTDGWDGIYQVRDTMNPKWTNRVDILTTNSRFKYDNITMYKYVDDIMVVDNS